MLHQRSWKFLATPSSTIILDVSRVIRSIDWYSALTTYQLVRAAYLCSISCVWMPRTHQNYLRCHRCRLGPSSDIKMHFCSVLAEKTTSLFLISPRAARLQDNSPSRVRWAKTASHHPDLSIKVSQAIQPHLKPRLIYPVETP